MCPQQLVVNPNRYTRLVPSYPRTYAYVSDFRLRAFSEAAPERNQIRKFFPALNFKICFFSCGFDQHGLACHAKHNKNGAVRVFSWRNHESISLLSRYSPIHPPLYIYQHSNKLLALRFLVVIKDMSNEYNRKVVNKEKSRHDVRNRS